MAIPVFDKFKSVTAEGKLLDYDEIAEAPIIRQDLNNNFPTEVGYYQHTGSKGSVFLPEVIYYFFKANETDTRLSYSSLDPQDYANAQMLEDGRYDLSAYGFVSANSDEATRIYSSNSIALETKGNFATRVYNSNNQLAGSISISTNGESVNIKGMSVGITADFGLVSLTSGDGVSLDLSDVAEFSSAVYAPSFIEGDKALSAKYASKTDVQHHIDFFEELSGGTYDLSAYKFWTKTELSNYVDGQALQEARYDLSAYGFATETYVDNSIASLVGGAPETLNALNEIAEALGNDPNFATTVSTEIGKKQNTIKGAATTITNSNLTASRALVSDANGKVAVSAVTSTELGYLDGVTSAIQTQLNGKLSTTGKAASATVADSANAVAWSKVSGKPTFATVATSGSYNDLSNKPTIPTTLPASDVYAWAKAKTKPSYSYSEITGKPTLATVATSGSYNDLSNKPTIPAAVSVTQKLTSGTEIGSVTIGSTTTKLYAPTATSVDLSGYLPLSGGTIKGNILFSNSNAQGAQPNLKWKTINSKTPYVGYCTASADGTFLVASLGGTSYTTGLSIGGSSGNLLWKGTRVATTSDIPSLSNYSTLANTIKALSISGKTITYTKGDGTTGTLTTQDTVYSLPTAGKNTLGGVKTTSTVTSASGYTACPIIGGVPYYKDTDGQLRQYYTHANMDVELPIIYSYNTTVSGTGDYKTTYGGVKAGFTFNPYTDTLSVGNIHMGALSIAKGDDWVDFMLNGGDAGLYMSYDENGDSYVDIYGDKVTINGFQPGGSGGGGSSGGWRQVTFSEFITSCTNGTIVRLVPNLDNDTSYSSRSYGFRTLGLQIVCADNGSFRVRNTEIDTYNDTQTALVFFTYELSRMDEDIIYSTLYQSLVDISNGVLVSDLMDEQELDDGNCEFYIWEG